MYALIAWGLLAAPFAGVAAESGAQVAVRGAYAPVARLGSFGFAEDFDAFVPVAIEIGYRLDREIYLGGYLEYGSGVSACPLIDLFECSGHAVGVGTDFRYYFSSRAAVAPWLGFAFGYQRARLFGRTRDSGLFTTDIDEIRMGIVAGLDLHLTSRLTIGPYLAGRVAGPVHATTEVGGTTRDGGGGTYALAEIGLRIGFGP